MPADPLRSAGAATSARADLERRMTAATDDATSAWLAGVARDALTNPTDPFTLGDVLRGWAVLTETIIGALPPGLPAEYTAAARARLAADPLPGEVYTSVRAALNLAAEQHATAGDTERAVRLALDPDTGGTTITAAATKVGGVSWRARQKRILRTEATAAYGQLTLVLLGANDVRFKRWVSHHDARVRPTHLAANGQTIPLNMPFVVGGHLAMFPADPALPPAERANCRCVLTGKRTVPQFLADVLPALPPGLPPLGLPPGRPTPPLIER